MTTGRLRSLRYLLPGLGLLAIASTAEAWGTGCAHTAERHARLDTTGASRVVINARAGDLDVRPATAGTLEARGKACASNDKSLQQIDVSVRRDGDAVLVDVLVPDGTGSFGTFYATLDLTVEVPASLPIEITDSSGDIVAENLKVVKVTDSSGDIVVRRPRSDIEIWDSSGDTRVEDAAGRVQVRDSSGDVVIVGAKEVVIPSDSSGDITIERVAGSVRIEQDSSGDIRIADVARDFTLLVDSSGEVKVSRVQGEISLP